MIRRSADVFFLFLFAVPVCGQAAEDARISNQSLLFCVSSYREGFYQKSLDCINQVLPQLQTGYDSLTAYEYLALAYGMLNQIDLSKRNFMMALKKNPLMEIDTLEFPPNISLIFSQVKMELEKARADSASSAARAEPARPRRSVFLPVVLLSTGACAAGAGSYFFYSSYQSYRNYSSATDQTLIDGYWDKHRTALFEGSACSGAAAVLVPVSLYLLLRKTPAREKTGLVIEKDGIRLAWLF